MRCVNLQGTQNNIGEKVNSNLFAMCIFNF